MSSKFFFSSYGILGSSFSTLHSQLMPFTQGLLLLCWKSRRIFFRRPVRGRGRTLLRQFSEPRPAVAYSVSTRFIFLGLLVAKIYSLKSHFIPRYFGYHIVIELSFFPVYIFTWQRGLSPLSLHDEFSRITVAKRKCPLNILLLCVSVYSTSELVWLKFLAYVWLLYNAGEKGKAKI
jgi:hypothetical protein